MNLLLLFFRFVDFVRRRRMKIKSYLTKKKIILYLENHNGRFSKDNFQIDPSTILNFRGGYVQIGKCFICRSFPYSIGNHTCSRIEVVNGILSIGNYSGFSNIVIQCYNNIKIGNYVNIGEGCMIMDSDFHRTNWRDRQDRSLDFHKAKSSPIVIDDYVFVGARSIILKGVHIGKHSIIAAGSVVNRDIPADCIAGGNPCKVIKLLD